jgi:hypothetical protein
MFCFFTPSLAINGVLLQAYKKKQYLLFTFCPLSFSGISTLLLVPSFYLYEDLIVALQNLKNGFLLSRNKPRIAGWA